MLFVQSGRCSGGRALRRLLFLCPRCGPPVGASPVDRCKHPLAVFSLVPLLMLRSGVQPVVERVARDHSLVVEWACRSLSRGRSGTSKGDIGRQFYLWRLGGDWPPRFLLSICPYRALEEIIPGFAWVTVWLQTYRPMALSAAFSARSMMRRVIVRPSLLPNPRRPNPIRCDGFRHAQRFSKVGMQAMTHSFASYSVPIGR